MSIHKKEEMNKKDYIVPGITVMTVKLQEFINYSGGGDQKGDPKVDPNGDNSNDDNRSRRRHRYQWDDGEDF